MCPQLLQQLLHVPAGRGRRQGQAAHSVRILPAHQVPWSSMQPSQQKRPAACSWRTHLAASMSGKTRPFGACTSAWAAQHCSTPAHAPHQACHGVKTSASTIAYELAAVGGAELRHRPAHALRVLQQLADGGPPLGQGLVRPAYKAYICVSASSALLSPSAA